jgi:serine/threonine-protein kinase
VGRYEVVEEFGKGGMGVVYKARDPVLGRVVALKCIRAAHLAGDDEVRRFLREAQAASRLQHPHIVPIYEMGHDGDIPYFTMPLVPGGCLRTHQERFGRDPRAAAALMEKVARAVQHAHDRGVLHRDLKPANVLLDERDEPLVCDFGLAKLLSAGGELTYPGQLLGTPAYMAPEQAAGAGRVTDRADVWALGVMLYELLTGRRPFPGDGREEVLAHVLRADLPRPRAVRPDLDPALEAVVLRCLEKDPARRGSAGELADDLGRWLRGEQVRARPSGAAARLGRAARRHPVRALALLLAALVLAALPAFALRRRAQDPVVPLQARLGRGEPAALLGDAGWPASCRWVTGGGKGQIAAAGDGTLSVSCWGSGLLELLPDPRQPRYRFRADVRHDQSDDPGEVGIYFLHRRADTPGGPAECFCQLAYNDVKDVAALVHLADGGNTAQMKLHLYQETGPPNLDLSVGALTSPKFQPVGLAPVKRWRRLEVEVTPEVVRAWWDGAALGERRLDGLAADAGKALAGPPAATDATGPAPLTPRSALGLYVCQGSASFRRVVVEPLPGQ